MSTHAHQPKGEHPMRPKAMHLRVTSTQTGGLIVDSFVTAFYSDGVVFRYTAQGKTEQMLCCGHRVELEP
jgi:hypothetical protein